MHILMKKRKKSCQWFLCAIGLALIPPYLVEKAWAEAMNDSTSDYVSSIKFNNYIVCTYVDCTSSLHLWNVLLIIFQSYGR